MLKQCVAAVISAFDEGFLATTLAGALLAGLNRTGNDGVLFTNSSRASQMIAHGSHLSTLVGLDSCQDRGFHSWAGRYLYLCVLYALGTGIWY